MRIGECDLYISDGYGGRAYGSTYSWFYWIEVTIQLQWRKNIHRI